MEPKIIHGGSHTDTRGTIQFVNQFAFDGIQRFYAITHPDTEIVRAWQGHKVEQKWFYVISGIFKVVLVQPDDWENPSLELPVREFELHADVPAILWIPSGYANGFKALVPDSKMIIFTNKTIRESVVDDLRFSAGLWYNWKQLTKIKND